MSEKFKGIYRSQTTRKPNWNYGWEAIYYITICTGDRDHYFGGIVNAEMNLSEIGNIVQEEWLKTPEVRPDMNLTLDEFVIMPNHFHALIEIGLNEYNKKEISSKQVFGPQSKNLPSIIRGFKSAVTINARRINPNFSWQSLYHDSIVWDNQSLSNIRRYIRNNPKNWIADEMNKNGI